MPLKLKHGTTIRPARCQYVFPDGRQCTYTPVTCPGHTAPAPCLRLKKGRRISAATAYDRYGCRCEKCREYKAAKNAKRCRKFAHFCPDCPLGFYTDKEFKEHWKSRHVKE